MNAPEILAAIGPIVEALEELGVAYHIGGSVASSVHGIPRLTIDADIVADLRLEHVRPLVKQLEAEYYIDADAVRESHQATQFVQRYSPGYNTEVHCVHSQDSPLRPGRAAQDKTRSTGRGDASVLYGISRRHNPKQVRMVQDGWGSIH